MTTDRDRQAALDIRSRWHRLSHSYDRNLARPEIRAVLSANSWNNGNFELQRVGLKRCLNADADQLQILKSYGWVLYRDAYDFTTEPVYQYVLLNVLRGLWRDMDAAAQSATLFERMAVRQTHGWAVSGRRAEPLALDHSGSAMGWIQIPFVWDDLLQVAFEGWLGSLHIDPRSSIVQACKTVERIDHRSVDWSPAHPGWNGLLGRTFVGRLQIHDEEEAVWAHQLCSSLPRLQPFVAHQTAVSSQHLGNTLTHLAKAFTIAHEASHILRQRQGRTFASRLDEEIDADQTAMGALWNEPCVINSEVRTGQNFETVWVASGLCFYFGLLVFGNLTRSVEDRVVDKETDLVQQEISQHETTTARMRVWIDLMKRLALRAENADLIMAVEHAGKLLPSLVAYCNALLDYGQDHGREAWHEVVTHIAPSMGLRVRN